MCARFVKNALGLFLGSDKTPCFYEQFTQPAPYLQLLFAQAVGQCSVMKLGGPLLFRQSRFRQTGKSAIIQRQSRPRFSIVDPQSKIPIEMLSSLEPLLL